MTATIMNVNAVIDQAKFRPFHLMVVLWCLFVVLFDGYDWAINGVALPLLMKEWGMTAIQAGMLASTALAGMMFGAMLFGMLADKIGRKKVIIICVTLFSGFTFAGGFASNPTEFGILRFIAGLGIGGVLPNLVALTSEYAQQKFRSTLVPAMFSGYVMGPIVIGVLLGMELPHKLNFIAVAIPAVLAAIAVSFLRLNSAEEAVKTQVKVSSSIKASSEAKF